MCTTSLRLVTNSTKISSCVLDTGGRRIDSSTPLRPSIHHQPLLFNPNPKHRTKEERTPVWAGAKAAALPAKRAKRASFILAVLLIGSRGVWLNATLRFRSPSPAPDREVAVRRVADIYEMFRSKNIFDKFIFTEIFTDHCQRHLEDFRHTVYAIYSFIIFIIIFYDQKTSIC